MATSWGKYNHANCQIYPDGTSSDKQSVAVPRLSLNNENGDKSATLELEWRLFVLFFKNLKSHNNGVAETDDLVRNIPKDIIFKAEADALFFFKSLDVMTTETSYVRIKGIKTALETGTASARRMICALVKCVSDQEIRRILSSARSRQSTPRCNSSGSSSDLTARSSASENGRRGSRDDLFKSHLTQRHLRPKRERTRDKVLNRMISKAYSTVNESLSAGNKSDESFLSPRRRRYSFGSTPSDQSSGVAISAASLPFRERIEVVNHLCQQGC